jgi:hypothetical protein
MRRFWAASMPTHLPGCDVPTARLRLDRFRVPQHGARAMSFQRAMMAAEKTLISEASLDELKEIADDLRSLAPEGSALADLAEARIAQIEAETDDRRMSSDCERT